MALAETMSVQWSSRLEVLADQLWNTVESTACTPFEKVCIVVNSPATENWLKQYFLLDRQNSGEKRGSRVLMNVKFVQLPEFLNDWLAALTHNTDPRRRCAARHPYSPGVLTWRIYRLLEQADPNGELQELLQYIGPDNDPMRRYALAEKLAKLFDDYQGSRFQMLRNWETGRDGGPKAVPVWQPALYRMLVAEDPETYVKDYAEAFRAPGRVPCGFTAVKAVHVFDIPFMQEPMLRLLEKISETVSLHVWCFNPKNEWLADSPSLREVIREHRKQLQNDALSETEERYFDINRFFVNPEERLFGTLASGARAVLWNLCSDMQGNVEVADAEDAVAGLKRLDISIHRTYSPRRELETVRDGLCAFFSRHPEAQARDAVVLCADWATYAPIVESVFGTGEKNIPLTMVGGIPGDTPFSRSFQDLLAFRRNRFEFSAVLNLLGNPAIRTQFQLDAAAVKSLRDMVKTANIHWGFDDADVRRILEVDPSAAAEHYPFTWKRGFARLIAEMLYGSSEDEADDLLLELGPFKNLHPCGKVEGDRAKLLGALWKLVENLHDLRQKLPSGSSLPVPELEQELLTVLETFYGANGQLLKTLNFTRKTIRNVAEAMKIGGIESVDADVFVKAVENALAGFSAGMRPHGNAVAFAPLNSYTATPHRLVWICGLNDGRFPQNEFRPAYDLIGKYPSFFDASARERGAFALLKAVLGARTELALSYVGKDIRTNEDVPPSVLFHDLTDYFTAAGVNVTSYRHPMRSYSRRYFQPAADPAERLPRSYFEQAQKIAEALQADKSAQGCIPFPLTADGPVEIALDDLADFFAVPNQYLLERQGANISACRYARIYDRERMEAKLNGKMAKTLALTGDCGENAAVLMVETGYSPDEESSDSAIAENAGLFKRVLKFSKDKSDFDCRNPDGSREKFAEAYQGFAAENPKEQVTEMQTLELNCGGHSVQLAVSMPHPVGLNAAKGECRTMIFYDSMDGDSTKNRLWLKHLGFNAAVGEVATFGFGSGKTKTGVLFLPLSREVAKERLQELILLAGTPLPPEFPCLKNVKNNDCLPPEWQRQLWSKDDLITTNQQGVR